MRLEEVQALYDQEQRREPEDPAMRREVAGPVVRLVSRHDRRSCVIYSSLSPENAEAAITEQIDYFNALGHGFEWKVYSHDTPSDLKERLVARGFALDETEAILVLDLQELPAPLAGLPRHDVRRVVDTGGLHDLLAVHQAVWGDDTMGLEDRLTRELRDQPERTSCYVAYVNGVAASAARLNIDPKSQFASLWGGSTVPAFRKQGLFTSLVVARAQEARQRGARFLTVDARPMSRSILEQLGFKLLFRQRLKLADVNRVEKDTRRRQDYRINRITPVVIRFCKSCNSDRYRRMAFVWLPTTTAPLSTMKCV